MAVLYVDGSCKSVGRAVVMGVGLVLLHNDSMVERSFVLPGSDRGRSFHEHMAVAMGYDLLLEFGVDPMKSTMFCDDEVAGHASFWLHPGNYSKRYDEAHTVVQAVKPDDRHFRNFLLNGRVVKLKGHSQEVYQERVDYLAKFAVRTGLGEYQDFIDYDDWLHAGFKKYDATVGAVVPYYPPFTKSL